MMPCGRAIPKENPVRERRHPMKSYHIFIRSFVAVLLIAALVACASTPKQESTGEFVDDSTITTKVKADLLADNILKGFEVSVETYKGIVELSGFVDTQVTKDRAGSIARKVAGVKQVKNNIIVK
jgi:osmotically-inducible protein OsmY